MPLTNAQKWLCKRAQAQAQLGDTEYRDLWRAVSGASSSTDPKLTDRQMDKFLALAETIYWRAVDAGEIDHAPERGHDPFINRGFWAHKNAGGKTSRERYAEKKIVEEIQTLEAKFEELGYDPAYCAKILETVLSNAPRSTPHAPTTLSIRDLLHYRAALQRTLTRKDPNHAQPA